MRFSRICLFFLTALPFFAKAQTTYTGGTYSSGALEVRITISHPCEGAPNEGFIRFEALSSVGVARLQVVGPISLFTQTPIPPGGYVHNAANTLPPGVYNYLIVDDKNTADPADDDVVNSVGLGGVEPSLTLVDLVTISLSEDANSANTSCTAPNGSFTSTVSGGSKDLPTGGDYAYTLTSGVTTIASGTTNGVAPLAFSGLTGGTYTLTINDTYSTCGGSRNFVIANPPLPIAPTGAANASYCAGQALASISVSAPTAPEEIDWYDAASDGVLLQANNNTFSPVAPGTYYAETRNSITGCVSASRTAVTLTELPLPTASTTGGGAVCSSDPLPTVTITLTGTLPFDVSYDTPGGTINLNDYNSTTITINNAPVGNYTVLSLVDNGGTGCVATDLGSTVTVTVVPAPTATVSVLPVTTCAGEAATLTFEMTGTPPFDVDYTDGTSTFSFSTNSITHTVNVNPTVTTTYTITSIADATICAGAAGANATVTVNTPPTSANLVAVGATTICEGQSATLRVNIAGGAPNYDFTIDNIPGAFFNYTSGTDIPVTPAATTTYTFATVVTDNNGCTVMGTGSVTITVNVLPTAIISGGGTVCDGATLPNVQFTFTGTPPFDFTYTDGVTSTPVNDYASAIFTIFNAPAGTYSVTSLVDQGGAGCTATALGTPVSVVVTPLSVPTISGLPPPEVCVGASVTFTTESGKTNYQWSFTGTGAVISAGGGATDDFVTLSWSDSDNTVAKSVNVRYVDNGCTSQITSETITVRPRPDLSFSPAPPTSVCEGTGGHVYTTNSGLNNYNWSVSLGGTITAGGGPADRTVTITWHTPGIQSVSVNADNAFGCSDNTPPTVNVTVNPLPSGQISGDATICSGTSTPLTFTLPTGTFNIVYTDGSSNFNASGLVSGGTVNVSPTVNTTYTIVSITNAATGCLVTAPDAAITGSATVTVTPAPNAGLTVTSADATVCEGGTTNIVVANSEVGVTYQLRDDNGDTPVGPPQPGNGAALNLPTNVLTASTTFNVLATLGGCSVELTQTVGVSVDPAPDLNLAVSPVLDPVCTGGSTSIRVQNSENGASYQLRINTTDIGSAVAGNGGDIFLPTGVLAATTTFNVLVTKGVCAPAQLANTATVTVAGAIDPTLTITAVQNPVCEGSATIVQIANSEVGVSYQLRNDADDSNVLTPVPGNGTTIDLPTGNLSSNVVFNVLAVSGTCSIEMDQTVALAVTPLPNVGLTVAPQDAAVCPGSNTNIVVQASESGVSYQLRNDADDSAVGTPVMGTGTAINLPVANLTVTTTFNVLATRGTCSVELSQTPSVIVLAVPGNGLVVTPQDLEVCPGTSTNIEITASENGVSYQLRNDGDNTPIGGAVVGDGGSILLPTGNLTATTTYNVLATVGGCSVELLQTPTVAVTTLPNTALAVTTESTPICAGSGTDIRVAAAENGVSYQLRNDVGDVPVGAPVVGTGVDLLLPTGTLTGNTTFNVLATRNSCGVELTATATVVVNPSPNVVLVVTADETTICAGQGTTIQIDASENGISYQLRNDADDSPIGSAVPGNGGTINLPTGTLLVTTTFNVLATVGSCSAELTQTPTVTTVPGASAVLPVSAQEAAICTGNGTNILIDNSETGVSYQLRNDADDSLIGTPVAGDGNTILLPTGILTATTTFNVLASSVTCDVELVNTATVTVSNNPNTGLLVAANSPICIGESSVVTVSASEVGVQYQLRTGVTPVGASVPGTGGLINLPTGALLTSTTFNVLATRGACTPAQLTNTASVTVNPIPGNPATFGIDTWIAYVYNDVNISGPGDVDYDVSKYRGFLSDTDIDALGASTYNTTTDVFDLNLSNSIPIAGPNVCGTFLNDYSVRFRMTKTFTAGVYTFTLGADDGVRLFIDGNPVTLNRLSVLSPTNSFTDHSYSEYRSTAQCLTAGTHDLVIEYYENGGFSRVRFDYSVAAEPTVSSPVTVCVNSAPPNLTASSSDPGVTGYNWYADAGMTILVANTQNYTPAASELDMNVATSEDFYVTAVFACGESQAALVTVDVVSAGNIVMAADPVQICQSAGPFDLTTVVTATPSGGTLTFTGTGVTGSNFDASQALGAYAITVDYVAGGCNASEILNIEIIDNATITVPGSATTLCEASGTFDLTTLVSASPVGGSFTFGGSGVTGNIFDPTGLSGNINITVDYTSGTCTDSESFVINVINSATINTSNTTICPNSGSIDLLTLVSALPAGGVFSFSGSPAIAGNIFNPSGVAGSTVVVNVSYDLGGCVAVGTLSVTVRSTTDALCGGGGGCTILPILSKTDATCEGINNGSITINAISGGTGPYEYSIDNGATFVSVGPLPFVIGSLASDDYAVIIKDTPGCLSSVNTIIIDNNITIAGTVVATDVTCLGGDGSIQINSPTGGTAPYEFSINGGTDFQTSDLFPALAVGSYSVVIRDDAGCLSSIIPVTVANGCTNGGTGTCATVVIVPKPSPATCTNSDGGIVFSIKPFTPTVNNTGVRISITGVSPTNQTIARTIFNDTTFVNLPLGTYDYEIEYGDPSCIKTGQVTIDRSGTIGVPVVTNPVSPACFGASTGGATIDVAGETGNQLEWSLDGVSWNTFVAGNQITGLPAGDLVLSVRRNSSDPCASGAVVSIAAPAEIVMTFSTTNATCNNNDGSISINAVSGGEAPYQFELDGVPVILPADNVIRQLPAKTYSLTVVDAKGCRRDYPLINVTFPGFIDITTPVGSAPSCLPSGNNGIINFQINTPGAYLVGYTTDLAAEPTNYFNPASANVLIPGLANGNWFIWMKRADGSGCVTKYPDPISIQGVSAVSFEAVTADVACFGETASILVSNLSGAQGVDFAYTLTNSADNSVATGAISFTQSLGDFSITGLNPGNYSLVISQNQSSVVPACTNPILSESQQFEIGGPSGALDTLYVARTISLPDLPTGTALVGIDPSGSEPYEASLELVDPIFASQSYFADWTAVNLNGQNLKFERTFTNMYAGVYELRVRDAAGCEKTYSITLDVDTNISIPNIFTPNGDGVNDVFFIRNLPGEAALVVTNRWGKEVFRSGSYQNDWNGGDVADGVYFYRLELPGEAVTGWVEILRGE